MNLTTIFAETSSWPIEIVGPIAVAFIVIVFGALVLVATILRSLWNIRKSNKLFTGITGSVVNPAGTAPALHVQASGKNYMAGLIIDLCLAIVLMAVPLLLISSASPFFWNNGAMHASAGALAVLLLAVRIPPRLVWKTTLGERVLRASKHSIKQRPFFWILDVIWILILYLLSL